MSFYPGAYAFGAAAVILPRALAFARSARLALGRSVRSWSRAAAPLAMAIPYLQVRNDQPGFNRTLADLPPLAADFGATDSRLSIWGSLLGKGGGWPIYGEPAFPGLFLLVLAPVGAISGLALRAPDAASPRSPGSRSWSSASRWAVGRRARPGGGGTRRTGCSSSTCRAGRRCAPPASAWVVGLLGVGLLAGFGALAIGHWLARRFQWRARTVIGVVAAVALFGVLAEGYAPWTAADGGTVDVAVPPVDQRLAELPPGGVLYLPALEQGAGGVAEALSGFRQAENVYGTTAHHRITPNGYSGFFPSSWKRLSREMEALPDAATLEHLRALGIRYVVVRDWAAGSVWAPLLDPASATPLRHVGTYDGDVLYEVPTRGNG